MESITQPARHESSGCLLFSFKQGRKYNQYITPKTKNCLQNSFEKKIFLLGALTGNISMLPPT